MPAPPPADSTPLCVTPTSKKHTMSGAGAQSGPQSPKYTAKAVEIIVSILKNKIEKCRVHKTRVGKNTNGTQRHNFYLG
jgi:hypothetical protein